MFVVVLLENYMKHKKKIYKTKEIFNKNEEFIYRPLNSINIYYSIHMEIVPYKWKIIQ